MKAHIQQLLAQALTKVRQDQDLPEVKEIQVGFTKDKKFGDFSSNIAMMLAKPAGRAPRELAQSIIDALPDDAKVTKVDIAGPGFINFYIDENAVLSVVTDVLAQKENFGCSQVGAGKRIHIEFVSANPTGPLHVGHGRGAAFGAACADLLAAIGYDVHREYYVNDAGRQMHILATSVWLRYLELLGEAIVFPSNGYKGDYIKTFAQQVLDAKGDTYRHAVNTVFADVPADDDGQGGGDKEAHIDALIVRAKTLLGEDDYQYIFDLAAEGITADIRDDLAEFGVNYQQWFKESELVESGAFEIAVAELKEKGLLYDNEGALWFKATEFGDDKDRVLVKENGDRTYFANDIAYHVNKYQRGFDQVIDVFGADHHGYVPRIKAMLKAFGHDVNDFSVLLVQFAILYRGSERVQMSTRSGSFVTLRELRDEVGDDAARYFYVMRKNEQHMDFDLELAKSRSNDNPVYYIQYAHARICSVLRQLAEKGWQHDVALGEESIALLQEPQEQSLVDRLSKYSDCLLNAAQQHEPHALANYLQGLAADFHAYYNAHQFLIEDAKQRNARLNLILAVQQVLKNGLKLLGVSAPESM